MEGAFVRTQGKVVPMLPSDVNGWSLVCKGAYLFLDCSLWWSLHSDTSLTA